MLAVHLFFISLNLHTASSPNCMPAGIKTMPNTQPGAAERYRLAISDGQHWCTAMLASQLNDVVKNGEVVNGCLLRLNEYLSQVMQGKRCKICDTYCPILITTSRSKETPCTSCPLSSYQLRRFLPSLDPLQTALLRSRVYQKVEI